MTMLGVFHTSRSSFKKDSDCVGCWHCIMTAGAGCMRSGGEDFTLCVISPLFLSSACYFTAVKPPGPQLVTSLSAIHHTPK